MQEEKTLTTIPYQLKRGMSLNYADILDGRWKGIPFGLLIALQNKIIHGLTPEQIKRRGWEYV